jgi:hypothetical protein
MKRNILLSLEPFTRHIETVIRLCPVHFDFDAEKLIELYSKIESQNAPTVRLTAPFYRTVAYQVCELKSQNSIDTRRRENRPRRQQIWGRLGATGLQDIRCQGFGGVWPADPRINSAMNKDFSSRSWAHLGNVKASNLSISFTMQNPTSTGFWKHTCHHIAIHQFLSQSIEISIQGPHLNTRFHHIFTKTIPPFDSRMQQKKTKKKS